MKKKILLIGIIVVILLIGIGLIFYLINNKNNVYKNDDNPLLSNAIVIKNSEGLYAIYSLDGKNLTDFKYTHISDFYNNHAIVINENDEYGIINSKGKMTIEFGKYKYLTKAGQLYKARDKDYKEYLINSNGDILYDLEGKEIDTFIIPKEIVIVRSSDTIDVLDYTGKSLIKLGYNKDDEYKLLDGEEKYATFFYKDTSYIIDIYKVKIVKEISSSIPYYVSSVNNIDNEKYVITSDNKDNEEYIYMNGAKEIFRTNEYTNLFFEGNNKNLIGVTLDKKRYIVDENGNKGIEVYKSNIEYIDGNNYIDVGDKSTTAFYVNGTLTKNVENTKPYTVASRDKKIYILKNTHSTNEDTYSYYNVNGEKMFNVDYKYAYGFDRDNVAKVSDDGKLFYLIDLKGRRVSNNYDKIDQYSFNSKLDYYEAKNGNVTYVLNTLGKEILSTTGTIEEKDNYFIVKENGKDTYYTFEGKEFYSSN